MGMLGQPYFRRHCFDSLRKNLMQAFQDNDQRLTAFVFGSSGIGKTTFLYDMLIYLVNQGRTVLLAGSAAGHAVNPVIVFRFHAYQPVRVGTYHDFESEIADLDTFILIDSVNFPSPFIRNCRIIAVASSASEDIYQKCFAEGFIRYIPVWELDELENCRKLVYSSVSHSKMMEQFKVWGGSVRHCLFHPAVASFEWSEESNLTFLTKIGQLSDCDLDSMIRAQTESIASPNHVSHSLLHIMANHDFSFGGLTICSLKAADAIRINWEAEGVFEDRFNRLILDSDNNKRLRSSVALLHQSYSVFCSTRSF
jgi:hypothetical protein